MITEMFLKFIFLDYIILFVLLRVCYMAVKKGFSIEIFKFCGVLFSTYIALHYYTALSDILQRRFLPEVMPLEFFDFIIFIILITLGYLCFVGLRSLLSRFIELKAVPRVDKILGLIFGIGRSFLIVGLLAYLLAISSIVYFKTSVKHSYLGSRALVILPSTYGWLWDNIFSKFSAHEKFNPMINETTDQIKRK